MAGRNDKTVTIRDLATGKLREIARDSIEENERNGTAMPAGFTSTLTRIELRDLVAYLANLKGAPALPASQ